jgi:hypothetical protein
VTAAETAWSPTATPEEVADRWGASLVDAGTTPPLSPDHPSPWGASQPWQPLDVADVRHALDDDSAGYDWTFTRFLEPQTRMIIAGDEGGGKSLLMKQIFVRLAAGLPVYGEEPPARPLRILIIDTELHERTVRRRLRPMARHARLPRGQLFYVLAPAGIDLSDNRADRDQFAKLVMAIRPDVIVIDSLYRAFNGDPDDPKVVGKLQRLLDQARDHSKAAIVLTAHYRKRSSDGRSTRSLDDLAGSRLMKAWPEIVVDVTKDKLRVLKDREGMAPPLTLERHLPGTWEDLDDGWPFVMHDADAAAPDSKPVWQGHTIVQRELLELLSRLDADASLSSNQVVTGLKDRRAQKQQKGFRRDTVLAALGELKDKGHADWVDGSKAGEQRWFITPAGLAATSTDAPDNPWTTGSQQLGNQSEPAGTSPPVTGSQGPSLSYGEGTGGTGRADQFPTTGTEGATA